VKAKIKETSTDTS